LLEEDGDSLLKKVPQAKRSHVTTLLLDVTKSEDIAAAVKSVSTFLEAKSLVLFALVNNAGVSCGGRSELA